MSEADPHAWIERDIYQHDKKARDMSEAKPAPLTDADSEALNRIGLEWLECVNSIIKRSAEIGPAWTQERAGALLAVLAQAGYTFIKFDDLSDDGETPKKAAATIAARDARIKELEAQLSICLICGETKPCMTEADLDADDPGVPCSFECPLDKERAAERDALRRGENEMSETKRDELLRRAEAGLKLAEALDAADNANTSDAERNMIQDARAAYWKAVTEPSSADTAHHAPQACNVKFGELVDENNEPLPPMGTDARPQAVTRAALLKKLYGDIGIDRVQAEIAADAILVLLAQKGASS